MNRPEEKLALVAKPTGFSGSISHIAAYGIFFKRFYAADIEADLRKLPLASDGMPLAAKECV